MGRWLGGRSVDDVKAWVLDHIDEWVIDWDNIGLTTDEHDQFQSIWEKIESGRMLSISDAKLLERELRRDMIHEIKYVPGGIDGIQIHHVDTWGMYADAWGLYCRPGTYGI